MNKEVQFSARMRPPEEALVTPNTQLLNHVLEHETFPRRSKFGVALEISARSDVEEGVEQTCIRDVDFGRLDLSLPDIFEPGLELPNDKGR